MQSVLLTHRVQPLPHLMLLVQHLSVRPRLRLRLRLRCRRRPVCSRPRRSGALC